MAKRSSKYNQRWTPEHAATMLDEAERSGLSDRAFAKRQGIDPQRLWWWRKRLENTTAIAKKDTGFVELAVRRTTSPAVAGRVEILLGNGRVVATSVDVDPMMLARLLDAVEGRRC